MRVIRFMPRRVGFTLLEVMLVTAISLLLVGVGTFTYINCLKIYKESQGITSVFETSKLIGRDLRDFLGNIVPLRGDFITPQCRNFPGGNDTDASKVSWSYLWWLRNYSYQNVINYAEFRPDVRFSGPQDGRSGYLDHVQRGDSRTGAPGAWGSNFAATAYKDWWLPGFYGKRDGGNAAVLSKYTVEAGSWGWPRPDYRLDADADDLTNHKNVACWFYAEDRYFESPYTLALDNSNIVLASVKFSVGMVGGGQETQLSFIKHHVNGFDHSTMGGTGLLRADSAYGKMLRAASITPRYLDDTGTLKEMKDGELGANLIGQAVPGGAEVPYCFDVRFRLRNPSSLQTHAFSLRIFNGNVPE